MTPPTTHPNCRPPRVQINEITVTSVHQSGALHLARPLLDTAAGAVGSGQR